MKNALKEKAVSFLQLVASGEVREAYRRYIKPIPENSPNENGVF